MRFFLPGAVVLAAIASATVVLTERGMAGAGATGSGFAVEPDTVVLWDFGTGDESFLIPDLSPSSIDLQPTGLSGEALPNATGKLSWGAGHFGKALDFPGNIYFRPVQRLSPEIDLSSGKVTVEAWINPSHLAEGRQVGVLQYWGTGGTGFRLSIHERRHVMWLVQTPNGERGISSAAKIPDDAWTHVAGTYDGQFLRVYVNGEFSGEQELADGVVQPSGNLGPQVGLLSAPDAPFFQGKISGIRISNTVRDTFVVE